MQLLWTKLVCDIKELRRPAHPKTIEKIVICYIYGAHFCVNDGVQKWVRDPPHYIWRRCLIDCIDQQDQGKIPSRELVLQEGAYDHVRTFG